MYMAESPGVNVGQECAPRPDMVSIMCVGDVLAASPEGLWICLGQRIVAPIDPPGIPIKSLGKVPEGGRLNAPRIELKVPDTPELLEATRVIFEGRAER